MGGVGWRGATAKITVGLCENLYIFMNILKIRKFLKKNHQEIPQEDACVPRCAWGLETSVCLFFFVHYGWNAVSVRDKAETHIHPRTTRDLWTEIGSVQLYRVVKEREYTRGRKKVEQPRRETYTRSRLVSL